MKRHSTDLTSLIFGGIFLSIVGWWAVSRYVHIAVPNFGWFAAGALILIGILGIAGSLRGERTREPVSAAPVSSFPTGPTSSSGSSFSTGPTSSSGSSFSTGTTTPTDEDDTLA